jgi:FKBP-type peptidyl-prolyl cis-trans isomerase
MVIRGFSDPANTPPVAVQDLPTTPTVTPPKGPIAPPTGPTYRSAKSNPPELPTVSADQWTTTESGLKYFDVEAGTGRTVSKGHNVMLEHTGWLEDAVRFDSSYQFDAPLKVQIGVGKLTEGWDEGIVGMKTGGKRVLEIPPGLAYGERGRPPLIPPNATVTYLIEVLNTRDN